MVKIYFENDPTDLGKQEVHGQIRNSDPKALSMEMLLEARGNPSLIIRAIVDLCVEQDYMRAQSLLDALKASTKSDDPSLERLGGRDYLFDEISSLLIVEYAYALMTINQPELNEVEKVKNNVRFFGRGFGFPTIATSLISDEMHKQSLDQFDFYDQPPQYLFEAMFINHLLDKESLG